MKNYKNVILVFWITMGIIVLLDILKVIYVNDFYVKICLLILTGLIFVNTGLEAKKNGNYLRFIIFTVVPILFGLIVSVALLVSYVH